jgi:hypothetical protein
MSFQISSIQAPAPTNTPNTSTNISNTDSRVNELATGLFQNLQITAPGAPIISRLPVPDTDPPALNLNTPT